MRNFVFLFGPLIVTAGALAACESDSSGPTPSFGLDGGPSEFDATVSDEGGQPETPTTVSVSVTNSKGPVANIRVVFHDGDGAVLETKTTDALGKATSSGELPKQVTAIVTTEESRQLVTWTGVEAGDNLALRTDDDTYDPIGTYSVTLPDLNGVFPSSVWVASGSCVAGGESNPVSLVLNANCVGTKGAVLASATDEETSERWHSFKKGNALPTDEGAVDVTTGTWALGKTLSVTRENLSDEETAEIAVLQIADERGVETGYSLVNLEGANEFTVADGFADAIQASLLVQTSDFTRQRRILTKRVPPTESIAFDWEQALPPILDTDATGTDPRRPTLTWSYDSNVPTDGGLVRIRVYGEDDRSYSWTFIVPPGTSTVSAPALPPEVIAEGFLPAADAEISVVDRPEVVFLEADVLPSYAALRQQGALFLLGIISYTSAPPAMPINGTYRLSINGQLDF